MPSVLVVDDARAEREMAAAIVSRWMDCSVLQAENGVEALSQVELHRPNIVVTDLLMPEMDGLELVRHIKEDYPRIPIIVMTGQGSEDVAAQALQSGAASYVPKSRLAKDLIVTLQQVHLTALGEQPHSHSPLMHFMTSTDTTFVIPNDREMLLRCVNQLLTMLRCLPLGDQTERLRVGIALEEAMYNAYYHGNLEVKSEAGDHTSRYAEVAAARCVQPKYSSRRIRVNARISREEAVFTIGDDGKGFDCSAFLTDAGIRNAGRGLTLITSIMDEVSYNQAGNEVTLRRQRVG
jgi:CheY-like chemotaxis protein/anti-sigma regulatory factor (Ser/Thr protein kinase)